MAIVRRILVALLALVGAALWVWFAAVRAVPGVRARKARARAERVAARGSQADA